MQFILIACGCNRNDRARSYGRVTHNDLWNLERYTGFLLIVFALSFYVHGRKLLVM